ncbi:MAG: hypothetical protein ACK4TA_07575 [Saprospiraceae bacterium]
MLKRYFQMNTWIVLGLIILIELIFNLMVQKYALNEATLYNSLANELTIEEIDNVSKLTHSYAWTTYLWAPLSIITQIFLIAICLTIGALLLRYEIRFKAIFGIVTKAFAIFALARLMLMGAYMYFGVNQLADLDYISKLSLYTLLNDRPLPDWAVMPLQTINLFQIAFILLLALGLNLLLKRGVTRWIPFVLGTYGTGLAISLVLFMLLTFL